jgi:fibronectin-binding autotransporter adhesin
VNRINSTQLASIAIAIILGLTTNNAFAQSRTAAAVEAFQGVDGSGNAMPGCGGAGGGGSGNNLTLSLNAALGTPGFDDEGANVDGRRTAYRVCDIQTATGANGWTGDASNTAGQTTTQNIAYAPEEVFATMDDANASFNVQTANVARRLSLVRLARRNDRKAAERLAKSSHPRTPSTLTPETPLGQADTTTSLTDRGPGSISTTDRTERLFLALQNGINAGDEIGGDGIGFFLNGRIHIVNGDSNPSERASDGFGGGFTLGADKTIGEDFFAGVAAGYTHIETNYNNSASDSSLDAVALSLYGAYFPTDQVVIDGSISIAYLGVDTSNEIVISDGGPSVPSLDGDADGVNVGFDIGVGYSETGTELARLVGLDELAAMEELTALTIEPFLRLSLLHTYIEDFSQTGGDASLKLEIDEQQNTSVTAMLGFATDYTVSTRVGVLTPYFRVAYVHEFVDQNDDLKVTSATAPTAPSFNLKAEATDSHYANVGVGVSATLGQGFSEFIDYDVVAWHDNVTIHQITAGMRLEF